MTPNSEQFGETSSGQRVDRVMLRGGGLAANILTWGATLQDLRLDGCDHPLVLGAPDFGPYLGALQYYGAIVGRVANRIAHGRFLLDGKGYDLNRNQEGRHTLHGGAAGTANRLWTLSETTESSACLSLTLPDGDMGFPGNLYVVAKYSLPGNGVLQLDITATTDAATPVNFAHHSYFNLDGFTSALDHEFQVDADRFLPVDDDFLSTGEVRNVSGTPQDFRTQKRIGTAGYDCNFCLSSGQVPVRQVAQLTGSTGNISMHLETTEPGLQFYDSHHLDPTGPVGLDGRSYGPHSGIALEPQGWPDAVNNPGFPNTILRPDESYHQRSRFIFRRNR